MPIEQRQIILFEEETLAAIQSYAHVKPDFLPHGQILGFRFKAPEERCGVELLVSLEAAYGATRTKLEVCAEDIAVVELLVRFCLENNIPIPRQADKHAVTADGLLRLADLLLI